MEKMESRGTFTEYLPSYAPLVLMLISRYYLVLSALARNAVVVVDQLQWRRHVQA